MWRYFDSFVAGGQPTRAHGRTLQQRGGRPGLNALAGYFQHSCAKMP